ncbi:TonB-dependent receptor [Polymorphobacter fuscus]|uniref:TonB-dependent receptor n=1 Tax=Sandarakinorhabdus fusca TaxID=1439888 RepID=A0A7C9GSB5_9SPHN|nr:TonB-dependent receptor [Polymorphobacter fuscus]KAB7646525.1 TonB-dependent receptor [Polymorphobacter fuscus]MQT17771.1 TonB-dependent receptor [Polymorphobacter fuscus]NJC09681.1 TonB-dependent receptor [Polymorphobacter fuscus]
MTTKSGLSARAILLAGIAATTLTGTGRAQVITAAAAAAADEDAEIIVSGSRPIAESQAAALQIQRNSDSLVSVLAADSIGRLPDQNIAQAISRLPGISVQRDQGQARYVNLRGAPLNWTTLSFDGIFIVSPEGRDARFDSIPSALASQVVVQKAVTPDLNGETIAGNVNIVTRSPFDYKGLHLQGKLGGGYVELGQGGEIEGSVVASNRFETGAGEIGILVTGSYYKRDMVTDNFEIDWETVSRDQRPAVPGEESPRVWGREIENKFYRLTRKNYSATGRLEWRPDSDNILFVSSIYTAFADDEQRDNYRIDADDQQGRVPNATAPCPGAGINPPAPFTTGYADVCTGNTPLAGRLFGVDFDARFRATAYRQSVFTNTIGGDHTNGDLTVKWRGNYTRSKDDRSLPYLHTYQSPGFGTNGVGGVDRITADYDFRDKNNSQVRLFRTLRSSTGVFSAGNQVQAYQDFPNGISSATALDAVDITDAYTGKVEAAWKTELFGDTTFRFGGQFDQRTKEANENLLEASGAGLNTALTAAGIPSSLNGIIGTESFRGRIEPGYKITYFSDAKARAILAVADGLADFEPQDANFYNVREQVWSGFAMGTTRFDWGNIVYGARVEHIKNRGTAFAIIEDTGTNELISVETSKTLVFPSAHINWNINRDMKVRLSFNTGAARPDYTVSRPNLTVNDADEAISGGNPLAQPERAKGVDLYWEWYVAPAGFVSLGAFYKDVTDVLFQDTRLFGLDTLNTPTFPNRSQYDYTTTVNGGDGHIAGVEAALQLQLDPFLKDSSWFGGFGIQANVTYTDSEATTPDGRKIRFPGTSQWTYNIGPYYEKYGVSIRASYQKRTSWLSEIGTPADTGGDIYWAADDELDVSARYAVTPNFEVYADASNLLNGPGRRYAGISQRTIERETFGRRYTAGIRVTY